jgi:hypothetical protein
MNHQLPEQGKPWPLYIAIAAAVLLVGLALFFAGRGTPPTPADPSQETAGASSVEADCDRQLSEILTSMDPLRLGVSTNIQDCEHDLNQWRTECGRPPDGKPIAEDAETVARLLAPEAAARAAAPEYSQRDVAHVRTSLMLRQLADHVAAGHDDPVAQSVALFDFVQRNVLDPPPGMVLPPLTLYEVLSYGRGTAEQRAWLFAELLRQIRIDAVLLEASPATMESTAPSTPAHGPLVGALVKQGEQVQVYVFDAAIGLPIPGPDEATSTEPFVMRPATLAQLRENDGLLRQLDVEGQPYPLTSAQLQVVRAGIVGTSSLWAERIALVAARTQFREAVFYDGLGTNRLRKPSLLDRVVAGGASGLWSAEQVFVWPLPEEQTTQYVSSDPNRDQILAGLNSIFQGPLMDSQPSGTGETLEWEQTLRDARNLLISGDFSGANAKLRSIRQSSILPSYRAQEPVNSAVQDFAAYWTALCQYEVGAFESVRNSAREYPPQGAGPALPPFWLDGVARLAAFSSAQLKIWPDALGALQTPVIRPTHGTIYLLKRWQRIAQPPAATETAPAGVTTPVQPSAPALGANAPEPNAAPAPSPAATPDATPPGAAP